MLRSVRFWLAAVLLATASFFGINKLTDQYDVSQDTEAEPVSGSETQPECSLTVLHDDLTGEETVPVTEAGSETGGYDASVPYISESQINDMMQKFNEASEYSDDLIGWIYIADSDIDYPVVQGTDNQYYLNHTPDGRQNTLGTIFLDCKCRNDFSDCQNILFGHNMQYGMFGDIRSYKDSESFDSHRYGWLLTKDCLYRIDFFALAVVSAFHKVYDVPADNEKWRSYIKENSLHYIETEFSDDDRFIALSTCASDFENARALFTGRLVPVPQQQ